MPRVRETGKYGREVFAIVWNKERGQYAVLLLSRLVIVSRLQVHILHSVPLLVQGVKAQDGLFDALRIVVGEAVAQVTKELPLLDRRKNFKLLKPV